MKDMPFLVPASGREPSPAPALCRGNAKLPLRIQILHGTQVTIPAEDKVELEMDRAHRDTHLCGRESTGPENGKTNSQKITELLKGL